MFTLFLRLFSTNFSCTILYSTSKYHYNRTLTSKFPLSRPTLVRLIASTFRRSYRPPARRNLYQPTRPNQGSEGKDFIEGQESEVNFLQYSLFLLLHRRGPLTRKITFCLELRCPSLVSCFWKVFGLLVPRLHLHPQLHGLGLFGSPLDRSYRRRDSEWSVRTTEEI